MTGVTRVRKLAAIRKFFAFLAENSILAGNPAHTVKGARREEKEPNILYKEQYNPRSRGLSEHGAFSCEECCIPAHMQGWGYRGEEDFGKPCQQWVVTRDSAWRCEHEGRNIAVFTRTLLSSLHSQSRNNHLCGRKNRIV